VNWRRREDLIGKEVIDADARRIGVAKDLAWSSDGGLALLIDLNDEEEAFLPFDEIQRIGDVVFVKAKSALEMAPTVVCPMCKHKNPPEAKYCGKCGRTLEGREEKKEKKS